MPEPGLLWLSVQAPFAAFRTFSAGSFRPTAPCITPSAAYGLLLNLAGVEMRRDDGKSPMTRIGEDLPAVEIAIGLVRRPSVQTIYQQLHNYPVGSSGADRAPACKGNKYNIAPARRAFLTDLHACLGLRADPGFVTRIRDALNGHGGKRYGLPFLGDNSFLPDRIDALGGPRPACWLIPLEPGDAPDSEDEPMRLTITIDRSNMARTVSRLFRLPREPTDQVPPEAWTAVSY